MDCNPSGSSVHEDSLGMNTGVECHALFRGIDTGIEPRSLVFPALAGGFFIINAPGKPSGQVSWPPVTAVAYVFTKAALRVFCSPELPSKLLL